MTTMVCVTARRLRGALKKTPFPHPPTQTPPPPRRGKRLQKHYSVFVAPVSAADRAAFHPVLNSEHREARWVALDELRGMPSEQLHPVVRLVLTEHARGLEDALRVGG